MQRLRRDEIRKFRQHIEGPICPNLQQHLCTELAANRSIRACERSRMEKQPDDVQIVVRRPYRSPGVRNEVCSLLWTAWNVVDVVQRGAAVIRWTLLNPATGVSADPCTLRSPEFDVQTKGSSSPS